MYLNEVTLGEQFFFSNEYIVVNFSPCELTTFATCVVMCSHWSIFSCSDELVFFSTPNRTGAKVDDTAFGCSNGGYFPERNRR